MAWEPVAKVFVGIDPGTNVLGLAALRSSPPLSARPALIAARSVPIIIKRPLERLLTVGQKVAEFVCEHMPAAVVVEDGYVGRNPRSALIVGEARGICIYEALRNCPHVVTEQPNQIRQLLGLKAGMKREEVNFQVRLRIQRLLDLSELPEEDAANALAAAYWLCDRERAKGAAPF